jgi:hypothetical protein
LLALEGTELLGSWAQDTVGGRDVGRLVLIVGSIPGGLISRLTDCKRWNCNLLGRGAVLETTLEHLPLETRTRRGRLQWFVKRQALVTKGLLGRELSIAVAVREDRVRSSGSHLRKEKSSRDEWIE